MKELSIKEKAKAYDEAYKKVAVRFGSNVANEIFLKESEDEMIRKGLINGFKFYSDQEYWGTEKFPLKIKDVIAWLEKQGEQNPTQEIEPTPIFRIGDVIKRKGKDYTFRVDRIQGGYYHSDRNHGAYFPIEDQDNWEFVEQKHTWSEEDIMRIDNLIAIIENRGYPDYVEYLEKLKDRVQPKPKQEWNIEDEEMLRRCISATFDHGYLKECDWMKSLKDRYTWKPSDEQMIYLSAAIEESNENPVLKSLYRDLKKLMEE